MAIITAEMQQKAREAYWNRKDSFLCFASGNTFAVKDDFKALGFTWDAESKVWMKECCSAWERFLYERRVADGLWPGVKLEFKPQAEI